MWGVVILFISGAVALLTLSPTLAQPSESGSISLGHQIAITICNHCHEDPTSSRKTAIGPKLEDIANVPSTTAQSLKEFLGSRHKRRMPDFILSKADTDDVVAYILSLKHD
jgi:mono/diheme cytochrome c family protein